MRNAEGEKVSDRITTVNPYVYAQYGSRDFSINAKVIYASAGEHINMLSGYGVTKVEADGSWDYAPLHSTASFLSVKYGRKVQVQGMIGYMKNLGTSKALYEDAAHPGYTSTSNVYISGNGFHNLNQLLLSQMRR